MEVRPNPSKLREGDSRPLPRGARPEKVTKNDAHGCVVERPVMILPQVHLRKPCYDFSFL